MRLSWIVRLRNPDGSPAGAVNLDLQVFDLGGRQWSSIGAATTDAEGQAKGEAALPGGAALAPALRLLETGDAPAALAGLPTVSLDARGTRLSVDFGEIARLAAAERVLPVRLIRRPAGAEAVPIGGLAGVAAGVQPAAIATRVAELGAETTTLRADLSRIGEERDALRLERDTLLGEVALAAGLNRKIADLGSELAEVRAENQRLRSDAQIAHEAAGGGAAQAAKAVGLREFAMTIGAEVNDAQTELRRRGLALGGVTITAHAELQEGGQKVKLPTSAELRAIPRGMLADLVLDFREAGPAPSDASGIVAPDVWGLTEGAARRVLASVGLTLEVSFGPSTIAPGTAPGQAMLQSPRPGAPVPRGSAVLVTFAQFPPEPDA